ncbi:jg26100 [Pararge aegeria aegeria]|uniref:Jg26100 protein n=1 Tax=Pararge aegeria aegeria TaxID=348720 RepID=A0A8S4SDL2_9NEOP|nr:jg26100 [Pararge aegeria aegeria]
MMSVSYVLDFKFIADTEIQCLKTKFFEQCVLPVMTYRSETWSLTMESGMRRSVEEPMDVGSSRCWNGDPTQVNLASRRSATNEVGRRHQTSRWKQAAQDRGFWNSLQKPTSSCGL